MSVNAAILPITFSVYEAAPLPSCACPPFATVYKGPLLPLPFSSLGPLGLSVKWAALSLPTSEIASASGRFDAGQY